MQPIFMKMEMKNKLIIQELNMENSSSLKTTFKYLDGTKIELQQDRSESPLLIFYPSGEISGGEIDLYHEDYIQRGN